MLRTRDFILVFTAVVFLVVAIGATWLAAWQSGGGNLDVEALQQQLQSPSQQLGAVIASSELVSREQRAAAMREKIASAPELYSPEPAVIQPVVEPVATTTVQSDSLAGALDQCGSYAAYLGFWDARNLAVVAGEGATLVVRTTLLANGSSTDTTLLQLPQRVAPAPDQSCIGSDVIGIANDGSLIRNDEVGLYSVFGAGTKIGYALDGFPIYGVGVSEVDSCGGLMVSGQYRYQLQADSDSVITCFAAAAVALP